jgi:glycosyltransferase involved in cell wall biosynthesis
MSLLVSILIPAFNAERWLEETIQSACAQTYQRREIIIVDDGSTDGTVAIARRFCSNSVKVLSQKNQGASKTRNTAFAHAQGDYIQWLDADDLLAPDKIERQISAALAGGDKTVLLSSAWGHFYHRVETASVRPTALWRDLTPREWLSLKMGRNLHMPNFTWLVSRELTNAAGPWDPRLTLDDDGEYFCRILLASSSVKFVEGAKGFYRRSSRLSQSQISTSDRKLRSQLLSMKLHINYLTSLEQGEGLRDICLQFLQRWSIHFYPERMDLVRELQEYARQVGGELPTPELPRKYRLIQALFGWSTAKRVRSAYNHFKSAVARFADRLLLQWQRSR